nr:MAG TPA: hypothetical protein [Caudoviricetes sp.]
MCRNENFFHNTRDFPCLNLVGCNPAFGTIRVTYR